MKHTVKIVTTRAEALETGDVFEDPHKQKGNRNWWRVDKVDPVGSEVLIYPANYAGHIRLSKFQPVRVQVDEGTKD